MVTVVPVWSVLLMFCLVVIGGLWLVIRTFFYGIPRIDSRWTFLVCVLLAALLIPGLRTIAWLALAGLAGVAAVKAMGHVQPAPPGLSAAAPLRMPKYRRRHSFRRPPLEDLDWDEETRYPQYEGSTMGTFLRTVGMLLLFAAGAGILGFSSTNIWQRQSSEETPRPLEFADTPVTSVSTDDALELRHLQPITKPLLEIDQPVVFISDPGYYGVYAPEEQLLGRISEYLGAALHEHYGVNAEDWKPSWSWIARDVVEQYGKIRSKDADTAGKEEVRMRVTLSRKRLEQVYQHYLDDQGWQRTLTLAKAYAGTVLIFGGLAIFLRLGTGRKVKLAGAPDTPDKDGHA